MFVVSSDFTRAVRLLLRPLSLLNPALKQVQKPRALAACKTLEGGVKTRTVLAGSKKVRRPPHGELAASKTKLRV